jgi:hypothetical protein
VTRQCPNVKNQLRYQIKRQNIAANNNQSQMSSNKTVNPYLQQLEMPKNMPQPPLSQPQISNMNNINNNDNDIFAMIR